MGDIIRCRPGTACIQKTKWKGAKSCRLADGYKFYYNGTSNERNEVAIAVSANFRDNIFLVERISGRLMAAKIYTRSEP